MYKIVNEYKQVIYNFVNVKNQYIVLNYTYM